MNRTYALVWNPSLGAWSVADEHARRRGKGAGAVLAAALLLPAMACAADLPTGGQVVAGQGQIGTPSNHQMVINQASNKLAIDWQSFDIAAGNKVTFNQPGSDAIALNRVLGADGSKIMGQLDANGRVFLINPNGVLFGRGAQVNVGGLVASTLDISNSDFEAGRYTFKGNGSNAGVINNGQITAADGGSVALLGGTVSNQGTIIANQGSVVLAAGNAMTLDFAGDGLLHVQVDEAVADALAENHQLIRADGGQVLLTAHAGEALLKTVVNNTGVIEARTLGEKNGKIVLLGDFTGGTVQVAGTLDASAPNGGNGGFVDTSGAHVQIQDGTRVTTLAANGKTGEWLIDPTDFTVSAGKAPQSDSGIGADILSANLNNTNVTLQTAVADNGTDKGDIHVNSEVIWSQDTTLTLSAHNSIHINASITAEHANGKLALYYGQRDGDEYGFVSGADYFINAPVNLQSGQNFSTKLGLDDSRYGGLIAYTVVNDAAALQTMRDNPAGAYAVGSNINLRSIANWQPVGNDARDADGNEASAFTGKFDGLGHTLSNLTINRVAENNVGLFGYVTGGQIRHVGLVDVNVLGGSNVGGLVGEQWNGGIRDAQVTGSVSGTNNVGGLVGSGHVSIKNAYANASVSGVNNVGGLVGEGGNISNAYASGNVSGTSYVGGLVGMGGAGSNVSNAYATGSVSGNKYVGGLVGYLSSSSDIKYTYAIGRVTGRATGTDEEPTDIGGLVGYRQGVGSITMGSISNSYWNTDTTGQASSSGSSSSAGKTTVQLQQASTYTGWDLSTTWGMATGTDGYVFYGMPTLQGVTPKAGYQYFDAGAGTADNPWVLSNWQQLQNINHIIGGTAGKHFVLAVSLDQDSIGYNTLASPTANAGAGWQPLGYGYTGFAGTFDGLGHTISGLTINRGNTNSVGLFGRTGSGSVIRNIGLVGGSVAGANDVGVLVGVNDRSTIYNVYATGSVSGARGVGGLVGGNSDGSISNAYATGSVSGTDQVGGLVGYSYRYNSYANNISNAYATGSVTGTSSVGGLVGYNYLGTISDAHATGRVSASNGHAGGLVGINDSGTLRNVYAAGSVFGDGVGGLVGRNVYGSIYNAYVTGNVEGGSDVGGLVGYHSEGFIEDAYVTGNVEGSNRVGGLVGYAYGGFIDDAYVTGNVAGSSNVGGLVGYSDRGTISNAYVTGSVSGVFDGLYGGGVNVGGLVGNNYGGMISNAYATGSVSGASRVGGLVGYNLGESISNAYATGSVSGINNDVGGLVGYHEGGSISNTYATGSVSGTSNVGGLVGYIFNYGYGEITASFYATTDAQGSSINNGGAATGAFAGNGVGVGKTWEELTQASTFAGWNIAGTGGTNAVWRIYEGHTGPLLRSFLQQVTVSASAGGITGKTYDGNVASGTTSYTTSLSGAALDGSLTYVTNSKNAGHYSKANGTLSLGGLFSGQQGYDISYANTNAALTIDKKSVTLSGITANNKTYDGTTAAALNITGTSFAGLVAGDSLSIGSASGAFDNKNAGTGKTVTVTGITLGGADAGNYALLSDTATITADINKAVLAISGITASDKTYDGTTAATLSGTASVTAIGGDDVAVSGTGLGSFADKHAGTGKTVTASGYTLTGSDAGNYSLVQPIGLTATISQKALTVSGISASDKTYNGTTAASLDTSNASFAGIVSGDSLSIGSASGAFTDKNAGMGKTVNITGITLSGADAGNYTLAADTATTAANIDKASISAVTGITAANRTYDGTTAATLDTTDASFSGIVSGDSLSIGSASGAFTDKNAGMGKTVTVTGITLGGADAGNYTLLSDAATTTADINKAALTISAHDASKVVGQGTTLSGYSTRGLVEGDSVSSLSLTSAGEPASAVAGNYAIVASNAIGSALSNYVIRYEDGTLRVSAATPEPGPVSDSQPYISVLASNGHTVSNESKRQAQEPEVVTQNMLATDPLDDHLNQDVFNQGMRLPEGI